MAIIKPIPPAMYSCYLFFCGVYVWLHHNNVQIKITTCDKNTASRNLIDDIQEGSMVFFRFITAFS